MKLVGATDWFIRWPFVIEGMIVGALGGVLAILLLAVGKVALIDPLAQPLRADRRAEHDQLRGCSIAVLLAACVARLGARLGPHRCAASCGSEHRRDTAGRAGTLRPRALRSPARRRRWRRCVRSRSSSASGSGGHPSSLPRLRCATRSSDDERRHARPRRST